jgi:cyanate permease
MKEESSVKETRGSKGEGKAPQESSYRWVMLGLLWLLYAAFSLVQRAISPLVTPILKDLSISYSEMGLILGGWQLTYIGAAFFAGALLDRWGIRKALFAGGLIIALSSVLRYFPTDFMGMLLAVALFGAGGPLISVGCPKAIAIWFSGKSRGTAVGIYMSGTYFGGLAGLILTNSLVMPLTGYSWRLTFVWYGLVSIAFALLWVLFARDTTPQVGQARIGMIETFLGLARIRNVQVVLAMGLLTFATIHGFSGWLPKILEGKGMSPSMAGILTSVSMAAGIPALLVIPRLVLPEWRGRFVASSALLTVIPLLLILFTSGWIQLTSLVLYGIAQAGFVPILTLILMETPEVEARFMGSAGGMFFCVAEMGGFAGPFAMGSLVDITGTFFSGALFCAFLNLAIIGLTFLLKPHSRPAG